jgi:septation ring formation regulator EzrA
MSNLAVSIAAADQCTTVAAELQNVRNDIMVLAKALVALQQRVSDAEMNMNEVRPQLVVMKVHGESIPQALRELRRGDSALQKKLDLLEERLRTLETVAVSAAQR